MSVNTSAHILRIAIFYDGGYFDEVSKYYKYGHSRQSRINLQGLHDFLRDRTARIEGGDISLTQIIEAHYFRGRFAAQTAIDHGKVEDERRFDDVLMHAGITTHYFPVDEQGGRPRERGIDVWLSLEAFDLAIHKEVDVIVLIACDTDYVPLVRKLNTLGTRVMLLAWDFRYEFDLGGKHYIKETKTSSQLIGATPYVLDMHKIIEEGLEEEIAPLFVD